MPRRPTFERGKTTLPSLPSLNLKKPQLERQKTSVNISERRTSLFLHEEDNYTFVAALEVGTSYSGYAYCARRDGKSIAKNIVVNPAWLLSDKSMTTLRTPSCLLLNDKKEFEAYGYEAEKLYLDLVREGKQNKWFFFRRFKPKINGVQDIRGNCLITDESGKSFLALRVFSLALRYLKSQLLNDICLRGQDASIEDIRWVITVPGYWSETAKQFMRKAALSAGIPDTMLKLGFDSEVASIFCQYMPSICDKLPINKSGTKYILADVGGGMTDIVVHEKRRDGLHEVSRGFGAKLGGGAVDNIFVQFLHKLLGDKITDEFVNRYRKEFLTMMREFEIQKRNVTPRTTSYIDLKVPACLQLLCQKQQYNDNLANVIFRSVYKGRVKLVGQKLRIDAVVSNEFFRAITVEIAKLINHSLTSFKSTQAVTVLVLTGALAESEVFQEIMHQELVGKTQIKQIIVPPDTDVAVLKGAVMFGHDPSLISCRVNRHTQGLRIARLFNPEIHPPNRRSVLNGVEYVLDIFSPFLTVGTRVPSGFISHQALTTTEPMQQKIEIDIYQSDSYSHSFVTDEGCGLLGKLEYQIPIPSEEARTIYVDVVLGDTELVLYVIDKKTGFKTKYYFPMLKDK